MLKRSSIIQPLGLAAILALGLGFTIWIVVVWCIQIVENARTQKKEKEEIAVLYDGTPVITVEQPYQEIVYRDLEHKTIFPKKMLTNVKLEHVTIAGPEDLDPQQFILVSGRFPLESGDRIQPFSESRHSRTYWYFIDDGKLDGRGYFMAFDRESKRCVGYLGMRGFSPDLPPPDDCFPMDGRKMAATATIWTRPAFAPCKRNSYEGNYYDYGPYDKIAMISGDRLLLIDLQGRTVSPVTKSADMISVGVMECFASLKELPVPVGQVRSYVFVRTTDSLIQFDLDGKQVGKYAIPEDYRKSAFDLYYLGDEKALIVQERTYPDHEGGVRLAWLEADGKIAQTKDVVLAGKGERDLSGAESWKLIVATPEPVGTMIWCLTLWANYYVAEDKTEYIAEVHKFLMGTWLPMLTLCIFSAALGWLCYRRQRRMALPGIWYWVGFVFLFGLPGYLAYLFHRRWPVLEDCHVCGHAVPRDREKCSHCGSEFPVPAPKGIEVFA